jgi:hypothetical protein
MAVSATRKAFAGKVSKEVGIPILEILELLDLLLPLIQKLPCFKKTNTREDVEANIIEVFRDSRVRKKDRCPARIHRAMQKFGYGSRKFREELWDSMTGNAFNMAPAVAGELCQ